MQCAERVGETGSEQLGHLGALLIGEAGAEMVGLRVLDVYLLVGDVHVSTDDDRFLLVEVEEVVAEGILPLHAVRQSLRLAAFGLRLLRVGRVDADEIKVGHLHGDDASFVVVLLLAQAVGDIQRLVTCIDSRAAVAFALGIVPI